MAAQPALQLTKPGVPDGGSPPWPPVPGAPPPRPAGRAGRAGRPARTMPRPRSQARFPRPWGHPARPLAVRRTGPKWIATRSVIDARPGLSARRAAAAVGRSESLRSHIRERSGLANADFEITDLPSLVPQFVLRGSDRAVFGETRHRLVEQALPWLFFGLSCVAPAVGETPVMSLCGESGG